MMYINVGEMCFIPMNVHNELFNGVRQLRWRHLFNIFYIYQAVILLFHIALHSPFSLSFCPYVCLSLSVVFHPVFLISCLSLRFGDVDVFFLQFKFFEVRHIHYPVNPSNAYFRTDAVVPSSDHCRNEIVLPPSDHYCIDS